MLAAAPRPLFDAPGLRFAALLGLVLWLHVALLDLLLPRRETATQRGVLPATVQSVELPTLASPQQARPAVAARPWCAPSKPVER